MQKFSTTNPKQTLFTKKQIHKEQINKEQINKEQKHKQTPELAIAVESPQRVCERGLVTNSAT